VFSFAVRRLLTSAIVLVVASFIVFAFVSLSGDPLGQLNIVPNVSEQSKQNIIEQKHLDDPIPVRWLYWVRDAATNQLGTTLLGNRPILPDLWRVMQNTLQLVLVAELLAIFFAIVIGVYSALRQYSVFDYTATTVSFLGLATPVFWLALMLQVLVVQIFQSTGVSLFPIASLNSVDPGSGLEFALDRAHHLVLPVLVLMFASVASYSRYVRAAMLEVLNSEYVRTARGKGLPERIVLRRHALRPALIPLVTIVALSFGNLLGGAIVVETVFSLDGMGLYFYNALLANDPYRVMAWFLVTATMIIVFNLLADIAYGYLDPRVRSYD
jgi:peptide/nickel transport system permease protein